MRPGAPARSPRASSPESQKVRLSRLIFGYVFWQTKSNGKLPLSPFSPGLGGAQTPQSSPLSPFGPGGASIPGPLGAPEEA